MAQQSATRRTRGRERPAEGHAARARRTAQQGASRGRETAEQAGQQAGNGAERVTGSLKSELLGSFGDVLGPALSQVSSQAAEKLLTYAKEQGPAVVKDQVLPKIMEQAGVDDPSELAKVGIGKAGQVISGAGGITGMAGKLMSKLGGGKGGKGVATGYGQGRRIMVQQVQYIPVNVEDVYRAWTSSEWPEYMHRVNTLDRQVEEDSARYSIGVKGLWFKKHFTAQVQEQVPFKYVVWSTTQGNIKNTGRVSFHGEGDDLTLMILNLDLAPSGLREKWVRGFRYHKRGIRGDFHRFSAWVQMRTQDELDGIEGWLGTIEGGKVTQSHEEYVEEHEEEQGRGDDDEEADDEEGQEEPEGQSEEPDDEDENGEDGQDGYEEMSVDDLRDELRDRGLPTRGRRDALIDRLHDSDAENGEGEGERERPRTRSRSRA